MTATHKDPAFRFASELLDEHLSDAQAIWGALELAVEHHPNLQGQEQYSHEIIVLLRILGGKLQVTV